MNKLSTALAIGAATVGVALGGFGIAAATSGSTVPSGPPGVDADDDPHERPDSDAPLGGSDLERAVAAALEHTGGGEVIETEIGDDGAAYAVEIRTAEGNQVEVDLDERFHVIGSARDDD